MNKLKDQIFLKHWLKLKPYDKQAPSDIFYLKLCNKVKHVTINNRYYFVLKLYLDKEEINSLSCFLTSYFEDVISGTRVWNTFIRKHTELYQKPLPFFDIEEYYEEEINYQDICFLIWYFLNTIQQKKLIAPYDDIILQLAEVVYNVFDEAWDDAPENNLLKTFYTIHEEETNFYKVRYLIDTILLKTYLFFPDTFLDFQDSEREIIENSENDENLLIYLNANRDQFIFKSHTRLLGFSGKEWAAWILGPKHPLHDPVMDISEKIQGYFFYKGQDTNDVFIEHIASGKKFNLTKKSFDRSHKLDEIDTIIYIGLVKWRNEWWFSGAYFNIEYNVDLVNEERNSMQSRLASNLSEPQDTKLKELLGKQWKAFFEFTNGNQIVFIETDKIDGFIKDFTNYYNKTQHQFKKEKARQGAKTDNFPGIEENLEDYTKYSESALIFFNPNSGIEVGLGVNSAFPLPHNPFFLKEESEDHLIGLFMSDELSKELSLFCIDHCKSELSFLNEEEGKTYLVDIDFMLRFWKKERYFTKPAVSIEDD